MQLSQQARENLEAALARAGQRNTRQREQVFAILLDQRDHPTADEVYARCRDQIPSISLATVYNCLETLVACGLVRQVNFEREPSRFCPNLSEHAHFHCRKTGKVVDIDLPPPIMAQLQEILPEGFSADSIELSYTGSIRNEDSPAFFN